MISEEHRHRVFRLIVLNQCLGIFSGSLFQNGFYLNYFTELGLSSAQIALLFSLPSFFGIFLLLPFAFYSDRWGKKRLALRGQWMLIASVVCMLIAGWAGSKSLLWIVAALLLYCVGGNLQGANWFALLNPIIPEKMRGRFFGRLRVTFLSVSIVFSFLISTVLLHSQSMVVFQSILLLVVTMAGLRYLTYSRIPELENEEGEEDHHKQPLFEALKEVWKVPSYLLFNGYIFLITFFTAAIPILFGLMQKDLFGFSPSKISMVGTWFLVGSLAGCWLGGQVVGRWGVRQVFKVTHIGFFLVFVGMLCWRLVPWSLFIHAAFCAAAYSLVVGVAGVASTFKIMALIPANNKSLSTAFTTTLISGAVAISQLLVSRTIAWVGVSKTAGILDSVYDLLLLFFTILIGLLFLFAFVFPPKTMRLRNQKSIY